MGTLGRHSSRMEEMELAERGARGGEQPGSDEAAGLEERQGPPSASSRCCGLRGAIVRVASFGALGGFLFGCENPPLACGTALSAGLDS